MEKKQEQVAKYGLIGKDIGYSFSRSFFKAKFEKESIDATYVNLDCKDVNEVRDCLEDKSINGFNVTIPYKEGVLPFLDELDEDAAAIGAVNTIKRMPNGNLKGFNTDFVGFSTSLLERPDGGFFKRALSESKTTPIALVLGTGGASKAVVYALKKMGVECQYISRKRTENTITYNDIDEDLILKSWIIVNCTPLGTFPDVSSYPDIPYEYLTLSHIAYDLIYNPAETVFLQNAKAQGATIFNGLSMLEAQAIASWKIWQS